VEPAASAALLWQVPSSGRDTIPYARLITIYGLAPAFVDGSGLLKWPLGRSQKSPPLLRPSRCMTLIRADARSPIQVSRGGEVLRLNTVTILFGALMASSFPSKVKHEAISLTGPVPGASNTQEPVSLPEFVSLINFSEFLLAAKANATESPSAREAAEILSAKFAGPSTGTNSEFLHAVVQNEPVTPSVLDAPPIDPKTPALMAALPQGQAPEEPKAEPVQAVVESAKPEATVEPPKTAEPDSDVGSRVRSPRHTKRTLARSAKQGPARQRRLKPEPTSSKKITSLDRLVGFVGLAPDPTLPN